MLLLRDLVNTKIPCYRCKWLKFKYELTNNTCILICNKFLQVCVSLELHRSWASLLLKEADNPIYKEREGSRGMMRAEDEEAKK